MDTFEAFEQCLQEALAHLYDPTYRPPQRLWEVMDSDLEGMEALQAALIREIEGLEPAPSVPANARVRRIYGLLSGLYVRGLTQEETAEQLCITPRHLRRERPEAIRALALRLWEKRQADQAPVPTGPRDVTTPPDDGTPAWRSQVQEELAALQAGAPGAMTDVQQAIERTVRLAQALTRDKEIDIQAGRVQPNLLVDGHPSVLREILLAAIRGLLQHMSSGEIMVGAERQEQRARITITGHPAAAPDRLESVFIQETIAMRGGTLTTDVTGRFASFRIELPTASQTVLVVDDNADIAHLYRRYAMGTDYHIVHTVQGQKVIELVERMAPKIIVLDVMLPDVDGWELLSHLREHPIAQTIPILVCSVVREQDLALALGADRYLTKPIERQAFIEALDQLLSQTLA
jgi:CheY-like chemotaxis protein